MEHLIDKARKIQCVICDLDGVLTDGLTYMDHAGHEHKAFHYQDGLGLKLLMSAGIEVAVITGSKNDLITHRMQQLDVKHCFTGQHNKQPAYDSLKKNLNLPDEAFAYIGDDLPDLLIMNQVGFSIAVSNAVQTVRDSAHWQTSSHGGRGAVREACDFILKAQEKQDSALQRYFNT